MRRQSKNKISTLKRKADRLLQDWFRKNFPNARCEICGKKFQVMHHFVEKSKSNYLRYHPFNLIFLCYQCHSKIQWDNTIQAKIAMKRGEEWFKKIEQLRKISKSPFTQKELEQIINIIKNSKKIEDLYQICQK